MRLFGATALVMIGRAPAGLAALDLLAHHLAALVVAAGGAGPVRERGLAAALALDELHGRDLVVVRAPHVALARGGSPLRDGHGLLLRLLLLLLLRGRSGGGA